MIISQAHTPLGTHPFRFVFFGTPAIAVASLEALAARTMLPSLIVTAPDAPQGRHLVLTPSPVKTWGLARGIPVISPKKLSEEGVAGALREANADVFVVVAYGKILPQWLLDLPRRGTLNMHPSLLPKHRGPSPIESQILIEKDVSDVGVSVMLLDETMDHGPVIAQARALPDIISREWPMRASILHPILASIGATLLAETLPQWVAKEIDVQDQDHNKATYCSKITKEDAHLDLSDDPEKLYRTFLAYDLWPRAFSTIEHNGRTVRFVITDAVLDDGHFIIKKVIPEGKKEMSYDDFLRGNA
jgi:methionyl-tRNA formyltransferase